MTGEAAIGSGSRFQPAGSVVSRVVGADLVLVDLDAEQFHSLNPVGALIWNELSGGGSVGSALVRVTAEFDVDDSTAKADTIELVEQLLSMGLLVPTTGDTGRSGPG